MIPYLSNARELRACHHVAVAGFWSASFEGGRKGGGERGRLLELRVGSGQTRLTTARMENPVRERSVKGSLALEQAGSLYKYLTKKRNPL